MKVCEVLQKNGGGGGGVNEQGIPAERQAGADQGNIELQRKKLCKSFILLIIVASDSQTMFYAK